ncbi:MAG: hypothetical protein ACQESG_02050 [Nanobdellota archaeon]
MPEKEKKWEMVGCVWETKNGRLQIKLGEKRYVGLRSKSTASNAPGFLIFDPIKEDQEEKVSISDTDAL